MTYSLVFQKYRCPSDQITDFLSVPGHEKYQMLLCLTEKICIQRAIKDNQIQTYFTVEKIVQKLNLLSTPQFCGLNIWRISNFNCTNWRPLVAVSTDPNDLTDLATEYSIIRAALTFMPEADMSSIFITSLERYWLLLMIYQGVWKEWSSDNFSQLWQQLNVRIY